MRYQQLYLINFRFLCLHIILLVQSLLLLTAPASGQDPSVRLTGEMPVSRLLDLAAAQTGVSIEYDDAVLRNASAVLRISRELTDQELWTLVNGVLASRGLVTVRADALGVLKVVRLQDATIDAGIDVRGPGPLVPTASPVGFANLVFEPKLASPVSLVEAISPLVAERGGRISVLGDGNLVLLTGPLDRLRPLEPIIQRLDSPARRPVLRSIVLKHRSAAEVIESARRFAVTRFTGNAPSRVGSLESGLDGASVVFIGPEAQFGTWLELVEFVDQPRSADRVVYPAGIFVASELAQTLEDLLGDARQSQRQLVVDSISNVLIVTAPAHDHREIAAFLERIRSVPESERTRTKYFEVRYRGVDEVRELLDELVSSDQFVNPEPTSREDTQRVDSESLPPRSNVGLSFAENESPKIVTDGVGNRLLVTGTPIQLEAIERAIKMIDTPHPQVVLEVIIVSLTEGESFDLGAEIRAETNNGDNVTLLSSLFGLSGAGTDGEFGTGSGATISTILPGEYEILLRALATVSEGRNVSRPKILVSNNQQATFQSVVQEPFTSTNASDTVATTSFGGTQDAGTTITVTPQITAGDRIRLEYSVSQSAFTGESADPSIPPPRQQNQVTSVVTIPDAHAIAVTGIVVESEGEAVSKVPLLGDIPGLGELFKARSRSNSRSRFYIFIKPDIVRSRGFEDLKYLSASDVVDARIRDDRPVLMPRIIR